MNPAAIEDLAIKLGWQEDGNGGGFWLWNLTRDIPGHPKGSTVTEATLEKAVARAQSINHTNEQ